MTLRNAILYSALSMEVQIEKREKQCRKFENHSYWRPRAHWNEYDGI